jgi:hypothetical protein
VIQKILIVILFLTAPVVLNAQEKIRFGIHADPIVSWFGTDIDSVRNVGARPGFSFGLTVNKPFSPNYSFSTGINIISAGGRLVNKKSTVLDLSYKNTSKEVTVDPNEAVLYNIQYLSIPLGLNLKTNQIGYVTFFTDVGIDPKVVIGGKLDIPSLDLKGEKANSELRLFNLSYHIIAGIEYGAGGNTAFVFGLGFDNNFLDITKENGTQPVDRVSHRLLSFRFGVNF